MKVRKKLFKGDVFVVVTKNKLSKFGSIGNMTTSGFRDPSSKPTWGNISSTGWSSYGTFLTNCDVIMFVWSRNGANRTKAFVKGLLAPETKIVGGATC